MRPMEERETEKVVGQTTNSNSAKQQPQPQRNATQQPQQRARNEKNSMVISFIYTITKCAHGLRFVGYCMLAIQNSQSRKRIVRISFI